MRTVAFASAAHEFRNPLNGISQSLTLLENQIPPCPAAQKYYQIAKNCSNHLLFLVNDILDFAQLEENKIYLNLQQEVNLEKLLAESVELLKFKADVKGLELLYVLSVDLLGTVNTDGGRLK